MEYFSLSAFLLVILVGFGEAAVSCDSDEFCQTLYDSTATTCLASTNECSNPFQKGCLRSRGVGGYADRIRVCTSNDDASSYSSSDDAVLCRTTDFPYPEIRIHNGDWSTSHLLAWIYQIVLVELLDVPVSVGLTTNMSQTADFYAPENKLQLSTVAYPYDALIKANEKVGSGENCEQTSEACAHVFPEVWVGQRD